MSTDGMLTPRVTPVGLQDFLEVGLAEALKLPSGLPSRGKKANVILDLLAGFKAHGMTCRTQYSIDNIIHGTAIWAVQHFSFESSPVRFDEGYRPSLHERFRRPPAIDRKQTAHGTSWPDAPLNLKPGVSIRQPLLFVEAKQPTQKLRQRHLVDL